MLKILFIGDIAGKIGRKTINKILPGLKKKLGINFVIANGENIAHGNGITADTIKEMTDAGVDWFTGGDHSFDRNKNLEEIYGGRLPLLRPANYSTQAPGQGYVLLDLKTSSKESAKLLLINLIGRVFMHQDYDCPFLTFDKILADPLLAGKKISAIIVDIHAEATAEKIALRHYLEGRVSALVGTHTHVMTADAGIKNGTAYITDVGMVGAAEGVIGVDKDNILKTFLSQIKYQHVIPEKGKAIFNAVLLAINSKTAQAVSLKPLTKFISIK